MATASVTTVTSKSIGINGDADAVNTAASDAVAVTGRTTRRRVLAGVSGAAALGVTAPLLGSTPADASARHHLPHHARHHAPPLWRLARQHGVVFGSAASTREFDDQDYVRLLDEQAEVLFTEDDLLWYKLKPTPTAALDFSYADQFFAHAERHRQLVFAAHLVWDEGFGDGWTDDDLWGLDEAAARKLLFGTARAMVDRYRGRVAGWIAANEVTDPEGDKGFRTEVPWYQTIGKSYVREIFELARDHDPHATLVLNEFGFETTNQYGDDPRARQLATLQVIDTLLRQGAPVDALGIQAHLLAEDFAHRFSPRTYRRFLDEVADRGLQILITEMDVLDDGLPADVRRRDIAVGDIYARYLDTVLGHPRVKAVMTFGLSDRYTWLEEDYPRDDGAGRRPLPYDADLRPKPALRALRRSLAGARHRRPIWRSRRHC
jgi:endo-1,4-beta-xylanase